MLTDTAVRKAKPRDKGYKLTDGHGLYLLVHPTGAKYWRLKYRIAGKEKGLALGVYPEITLAEAREKQAEARKLISNGVDPVEAKRERKRLAKARSENSFENVAREWHEQQKSRWSGFVAQIVAQTMSLVVLGYAKEDCQSQIPPAQLAGV